MGEDVDDGVDDEEAKLLPKTSELFPADTRNTAGVATAASSNDPVTPPAARTRNTLDKLATICDRALALGTRKTATKEKNKGVDGHQEKAEPQEQLENSNNIAGCTIFSSKVKVRSAKEVQNMTAEGSGAEGNSGIHDSSQGGDSSDLVDGDDIGVRGRLGISSPTQQGRSRGEDVRAIST